MASIVRGQANTTSKVNWFITVGAALNDAHEIGFKILDITAGLPGIQIFPAVSGDYEDVTAAPGHFGTGRYYAYDNGASVGWTPNLAASLGTHRITWRWKIDAGAAYQTGQEDFEVLAEDGVAPSDTYITVQDIRDEGITVAMADDVEVLSTIQVCQAFIDRACRQWFDARVLTIRFDGTDSDTIHMGVPIIAIEYLRINDSVTDLDTDLFAVYSSRLYPDDRRNPRIKLARRDNYNIFTGPVGYGTPLKFRKGRQNQEVKGTFGFIEEDDSTPELIKRALTKLTIEKLQSPLFHDESTGAPSVPPPPPIVGPLLEEETDDHRQKYAQAGGTISPRRPGLTGITDDQEIHDIIKLYRAPLGMATPAHWSYY